MQLLLVFSLSTAVSLAFGAPATVSHQNQIQPPRIFGNKNRNVVTPYADEKEEELELESLKSHQNKAESVTSPSPDITTTHISANAKKPENEEKPAISDNANSLKYPHHNPDGFDESLFTKKNQHHVTEQGLDGQPQINNGFGGLIDISSTPQDFAEYIFWTGDEGGVANAIYDFLKQGLLSQEEGVRFLEDVKLELASIRARYSASLAHSQGQQQQQAGALFHNNFNSIQDSGYKGYLPGGRDFVHPIKKESYSEIPADVYFHGQEDQPLLQLTPGVGVNGNPNLLSNEELDYDEIAQKLFRSVQREYALEDLIYQIASDLFAESLKTENSPGESTQRFSEFIEAQAASGKIPKDLEKDVLEALVSAFVDTASNFEVVKHLEHQKALEQLSPRATNQIAAGPIGSIHSAKATLHSPPIKSHRK